MDGQTDRQADGQTDVGHINLIGGLVTRNPPKNTSPMKIINIIPMLHTCIILLSSLVIYFFCIFSLLTLFPEYLTGPSSFSLAVCILLLL